MRINTNINSMNACRNMTINNKKLAASSEKLSSGYRINKAGDDAAGLAISEKMRSQIRGLNQASSNAEDANSLIQTAEGALNETHSILQRMNELAVQSANDTNVSNDRSALQDEMNELSKELTRISSDTEFNKQTLLDGSFAGTFHIGANTNQSISLSIDNMSAKSLGVCDIASSAVVSGNLTFTNRTLSAVHISTVALDTNETTKTTAAKDASGNITITLAHKSDGTTITATNKDVADALATLGVTTEITAGKENTTAAAIGSAVDVAAGTADEIKGIDVSTQNCANSAITTIQNAIQTVSTERSKLGAYQNRLDHTVNNLGTSSENLSAAESRIRDVDMAKEMSEFTKNSVLAQAAQSMVAQANSQPQSVLSLLQ